MGSSTSKPHADIIASELENAIPTGILSGFILPERSRAAQALKSKTLERRIFDIANKVAIEKKLTMLYSNYHTWETFRGIETKKKACEAVAAAMPPSHTPSFGNCLFMANACAEALRAALLAENDPALVPYAEHVQLATDNWHQQAKSSREYHCIAMIRLADCCIVLDIIAHAYAIKVPLGEITSCGGSKFCYVAASGARLLVWYSAGEPYNVLEHPESQGKFTYDDPYRDIVGGFEGGIANLAFPSDSYLGRLPSRRSIVVQDIWDREPTSGNRYVPLEDGSGRFLVETCHLRIDFVKRELSFEEIPYTDWLARQHNSYFLRRLRYRKGYVEYDGQVSYTLALGTSSKAQPGFSKKVANSLEFLNELCEALGLPKGELLRIANVMLEVWQGTGDPKSLKRKRAD